MKRLTPTTSLLTLAAALLIAAGARAEETPFNGVESTWHDGFVRYDYAMGEKSLAITPFQRDADEGFGVKGPAPGTRRCIVVAPKEAAPGRPWSWQACYWDHEPQAEVELLRRGFHVAFITPEPDRCWDAWYEFLTEKHGLSRKPAFVGMSRGGVNEYDWATNNPDKVLCIYADNPAIRASAFAKLGELARHDIPLLNICGSQDFLLERHTLPIERRYRELGGRITVMIKEGPAHHPHSVRDPKPIADWVFEQYKPQQRQKPGFVDGSYARSNYYGDETSFTPLKEEGTFAAARGPGFVPYYERYDAGTGSPWGVSGMTVVVPSTPAEGKPWVLKAQRIDGTTGAVDLALLDKGYHLVCPPLTAQAGPLREDWDAAYRLMTEHGFAKKAVLEGSGTAAGEAYAWAEENPGKVAGIYAENPALRSLMAKTPPIERLDVLAKAGVPLVHACGSLDPWLAGETRVVEEEYRRLGGRITVLVDEGKGHFPLAPRDSGAVVTLIETFPR